MNRIAIKCLAFVLLVTLSSQFANAQAVGFLSTNDILYNMSDVKQANSKLETLETQLKKQGELMVSKAQNKLKKAQDDYAKGLLTAKDVSRIEEELKVEESEIVKFGDTAQEDLAKKRQELFEPILARIQVAIDDIVAEQKLSFVFDASIGSILYADETLDITDKVKAKLGMP